MKSEMLTASTLAPAPASARGMEPHEQVASAPPSVWQFDRRAGGLAAEPDRCGPVASVTGAPSTVPLGSGRSATSCPTVTGPASSRWPPDALGQRVVGCDHRVGRWTRPDLRPAVSRSVGAHATGRPGELGRPLRARRTTAARPAPAGTAPVKAADRAARRRPVARGVGRGPRGPRRRREARARTVATGSPAGAERARAPRPTGHRPGSALLEGRTVEEGEGPPGQDPVGEG